MYSIKLIYISKRLTIIKLGREVQPKNIKEENKNTTRSKLNEKQTWRLSEK